MPICTTCTHSISHLYTVYESAYNLRLEQCVRTHTLSRVSIASANPWYQTECHSFADPYVEHDTLTLALDLILLKRGVYRHLLYNRGSEPRKAGSANVDTDEVQDSLALKQKDNHREWVSKCSTQFFCG